jgi:ankyrin repeat protein
MKSLNIAFAAATFGLMTAPAAAQSLGSGSNSDQFVEAVQKSDGDKATQLIEDHPTLIDARNAKGDTGLIIAIGRSDFNWTAFMLKGGADPNLAGANGDTPLIAATKVGFDQGVEWLLQVGAKVDGTNRMGETPLIVAVQQRDATIARLLLNAGANPDKTDTAAGYSARDYATRDPRARDILKLINDKKPKAATSASK